MVNKFNWKKFEALKTCLIYYGIKMIISMLCVIAICRIFFVSEILKVIRVLIFELVVVDCNKKKNHKVCF